MLPLGTCGRAKWRKAWPSCFTAARTTSRRIIEPLCPNSVDGNVFQIPRNIRMDQACAGILLHVPFISIHQPKQWRVHAIVRNVHLHASATAHFLQAQTPVFLSHLQICLKFLGCKLQAETLLLHRVQHKVHLLKGHRTTNWACPCSDLTMISTLRERNGDRHIVPICMIPCLWWVELREHSIKFGRSHGRTF